MKPPYPDYPRYEVASFAPGDTRREKMAIPSGAVEAYMALTGDRHPLHSDADHARSRGFRDRVCHGLLLSAYLSPFIARNFLGSAGLLVSFQARFQGPAYEGDGLVLTGCVESVSKSTGLISISLTVERESGELVLNGTAGGLLRVNGS